MISEKEEKIASLTAFDIESKSSMLPKDIQRLLQHSVTNGLKRGELNLSGM